MVLSSDALNLVLYCAQQLGMALAVGAEGVMLVAYLSSIRDGVVDKTETRLARAVQNVLYTGVVLIVASGFVITFLHLSAGEASTVFEPTYLFKWLLIVLAIALGASWYKLPQTLMNGLAGGTWFALFAVHVLAPMTSWFNLLVLYVLWMAGFNLCWWGIVWGFKPHLYKPATAPASPAPKSSAKRPLTLTSFSPKLPALFHKKAPSAAPAAHPPAPAPAAPVVKTTPPPPQPPPPPPPVAPVKPVEQRPHSGVSNTLPLQKDPLAPTPFKPMATSNASTPIQQTPPAPPQASQDKRTPSEALAKDGPGLSAVNVMPKKPDEPQ